MDKQEDKSLRETVVYGTSVIGGKGSIVIPAKLRKEYNLQQGDTIIFIGSPYTDAFHAVKAETVQSLREQLDKLEALEGDLVKVRKNKEKKN